MKNSIIYILLGIGTLLILGIASQKYLIYVSQELLNVVGELESESQSDKRIEKVDEIMEKWEKSKKILAIIVDHQDIHKIESSLIEIENILKNNLSCSHVSTNFSLLKLYIENIAEENRFTIENIL